MMALAALALVASSCSTVDTPKPAPVIRTVYVKLKLPPAARVPCNPPVAMPRPARKLTDKETGDDWGADRASLRICEQRRAAAVAAGE